MPIVQTVARSRHCKRRCWRSSWCWLRCRAASSGSPSALSSSARCARSGHGARSMSPWGPSRGLGTGVHHVAVIRRAAPRSAADSSRAPRRRPSKNRATAAADGVDRSSNTVVHLCSAIDAHQPGRRTNLPWDRSQALFRLPAPVPLAPAACHLWSALAASSSDRLPTQGC